MTARFGRNSPRRPLRVPLCDASPTARRRAAGHEKGVRISRSAPLFVPHEASGNLADQIDQGRTSRAGQFPSVDGAIIVRVSGLELRLDGGKVFLLVEGAVVVRVELLEVGLADAALELLGIERAVLIRIELVEGSGAGGQGLLQIDRAVLVRIEGGDIDLRGRRRGGVGRSGDERSEQNGRGEAERHRGKLLIEEARRNRANGKIAETLATTIPQANMPPDERPFGLA
ncbi:protein of unknown function [Methylorubrum extorquens]|uniref:Uncharacterized protein n=1 Tax=Methylorubrum extorquens TaxID=408 RepID=A0A2N9AU23_METEX|nr:protein of unknown function [Methylorubrum extorquens]